MSAKNELDKTVAEVRKAVGEVHKDLIASPTLNKHYKSETELFQKYAVELAAVQGQLKSTGKLSPEALQNLSSISKDEILSQIGAMISANTQMRGMTPMNTRKSISDTLGAGLNKKLGALHGEVLELFSALHAAIAEEDAHTSPSQDTTTSMDEEQTHVSSQPDQETQADSDDVAAVPKVDVLGKATIYPEPTLDELIAAFDKTLKAVSYAKPQGSQQK